MPRLTLRLLGPPRVWHGDAVITFPTRKALALLIYCAVEGGPHPRPKLAQLLWPESGQAAGRATLRSSLLRIQRAIGESGEHLAASRDQVRFHPEECDLDVDGLREAERAARSIEALPAGDVRRHAISELQHRTEYYRSEFLQGFSLSDAPEFEEWSWLQRERCRRWREGILDCISHAQVVEGQFAAAAETVNEWLTADALAEKAHRRLIEIRLATGDQVGARRAYEDCRNLLAERLGMEPAPETEALGARITTARQAVARVSSPARTSRPWYMQAPLVGRSAEMSRLVELFSAVVGGRTSVAFIRGEAGIGKSRLAAEFLEWARRQGADCVQSRAFETEGRLPYQPLVDALRPRLDQENAPADLLTDVWLAELTRLLPELRDRYPDLPQPAGEEASARGRLYEAVARLVQSLSAERPVILFIDDVQWSDVASLDVLRYAIRRWTEAGARVLPLFAIRTEALAQTPALEEWVAGASRDNQVERIELGPLSPAEAGQLLRGLGVDQTPEPAGDASEPRDVATWFYAETGGHPLFIVETLRALIDSGTARPRPTSSGDWAVEVDVRAAGQLSPGFVAPGVRDVIRSRSQRLARASQLLLSAAAVLARPFTFDEALSVAQLDEEAGLKALDEVLDAGMVRQARTRDERSPVAWYGFSHDKIRDTIYVETGDERRRLLHRRALAVLGSRSAPPAELAHHAISAGLAGDALQLHIAAGEDASELLAARDAAAHYSRALDLATTLGRHDLLPQLHCAKGRALVSAALWAEAREELEAALELMRDDEQQRRVELLVELLEVYWWLLDIPAMRELADRAIELAKGVHRPDLELAATAWLAGAEGADGHLVACVAESRRTLRRAARLGIPPPAHVQTHHSLSLYWLGRAEEAIEASRQAVTAARAASDVPLLMYSLAHLSLANAGAGRYGEAAAGFQELRRLGTDYGIPTLLARSIAMSAGYPLDLFDYARAEEIAQEARELALSVDFGPPAVSAGIDLVLNYARRGDVARAEKLFDEVAAAAERAAGFHGWLWRLRVAAASAELALARGASERAVELATSADRQSRVAGRPKQRVLALVARSRAFSTLGRTRKAIGDLEAAVRIARSTNDPALFIRAAGPLLALDGKDELAVEWREIASRLSRVIPEIGTRERFESAIAELLR